MTDWDPKDAMGSLSYLKFKLHGWVQLSSVPEWVQEAARDYDGGYQNKYGQRPYDMSKDFYGDSLPYRVKYEIVTDYSEMDLTGKGRSMSMNYFAEDFQGVQIELPRKVAYHKFHTVPEAVADGFAHLLEQCIHDNCNPAYIFCDMYLCIVRVANDVGGSCQMVTEEINGRIE